MLPDSRDLPLPRTFPLAHHGAVRSRHRRWALLGLVLAASALFMFFDLHLMPIQLWDESRVIVNALEMSRHGLSLATTYGDRPDLWNTKPPLLVWAMVASIWTFGASEAALRAPAMLCGLATVAIVFGFTRKLSGSSATATLAAALLTLSCGFYGLHAARTADYDAPLTLFTTAYACASFFAVHRRRPTAKTLAVIAALIAAALMTKSVAALPPGLGVAAYALSIGRGQRLASWRYVAMGAGAVVPVLVFIGAREQAVPGYIRAALFNDVYGRFGTALDQHSHSPMFYFDACFVRGLFSAGLVGLAAPLALIGGRGRPRLALIFCLCMSAAILGVDTAAATRLPQYATPAYPFLAIATALGAQALVVWARRCDRQAAAKVSLLTFDRAVRLGLSVVMAAIVAHSVRLRYWELPRQMHQPQALYGEVLLRLADRGATRVRVVDDGVWGPGVPHNYMPQLRAHILMWTPKGLDVARSGDLREAVQTPNAYIVTCDPGRLGELRQLGPDVAGVADCVALRPAMRP